MSGRYSRLSHILGSLISMGGGGGAASWAFRLGAPGEIIQVYGDWASDAYKSYLEMSMADKLQLAYRMCQVLS